MSDIGASGAGVTTSQAPALPRGGKASEKRGAVTQSLAAVSVSASHLGFLFLLLHVTVVQAYGSCCVGAADVCEATYDDNFFITFHCVGANWVGPLQICEDCQPDLTNTGYAIVIGVPLFILILCVVGCVYACCFKKNTSDGAIFVTYSPDPPRGVALTAPLLSATNASVNQGYGTH